mmetsp:Transcript_15943/g.49955  ORF Transcript_15943/g.49955 Transcript_15943/m.49955 type:complete len:267 (+) Transcript_15943:164-964(+)
MGMTRCWCRRAGRRGLLGCERRVPAGCCPRSRRPRWRTPPARWVGGRSAWRAWSAWRAATDAPSARSIGRRLTPQRRIELRAQRSSAMARYRAMRRTRSRRRARRATTTTRAHKFCANSSNELRSRLVSPSSRSPFPAPRPAMAPMRPSARRRSSTCFSTLLTLLRATPLYGAPVSLPREEEPPGATSCSRRPSRAETSHATILCSSCFSRPCNVPLRPNASRRLAALWWLRRRNRSTDYAPLPTKEDDAPVVAIAVENFQAGTPV